jgi:hypothetical protein
MPHVDGRLLPFTGERAMTSAEIAPRRTSPVDPVDESLACIEHL